MKPNFKSIIIVVILVISIFPLVIELGSDHSTVEAATIYVDDDGQANYTTIQAAINAAISGDTIEVWAGTYNENLNVNKQVNLVGNGSLVTTINAGGSTDGIYVSANSVTITGFTIINSGPVSGDCGIELDTVDYCTVQDCNITSTFYAIYLKYSTNCLIRNNNCSNNIWGVPVGSSSYYNIVRNNTCNDNDYGISIAGKSENNTVENNVCNYNTFMGIGIGGATNNYIFNNTCLKNDWGVSLSSSANLNIIRNNTCNPSKEEGIYVYFFSSNNVIENNNCSGPFYGILLNNNCNRNKIKNNTCYSSSNGIRLNSCTDVLIKNNTCIENSFAGIYLGGSSNNNLICNNTLINSAEYGVYVSSSYNINISNNSMYNCGLFIGGSFVNHWNTHVIDTSNVVNNKPIIYWKDVNGGTPPTGAGQVILANCDNVIVQNQTLSNCSNGILIGYSSDNILFNNTCNWNQRGYGIHLYYSSNNLIKNNTCNHNSFGIALRDNSNYNQIENNTCNYGGTKFMFGNGIYIQSSYNRIENNTCSYKESYGIRLGSALNNIVRYNNVSYNGRNGIFLSQAYYSTVDNNDCYKNGNGTMLLSSDDTTFYDNLISNNLFNGLYFDISSDDNHIYHNSIINNTVQATDLGTTYWVTYNDGSWEGNYWSDYTGLDDGSGGRTAGDGIGDTNIPHLGLDNFPFIKAWDWKIPEVPVLTDPGTYDPDGNYTISWSHCNKSLGYTLQEDISNTFDSPVIVYNSSNTFCNINPKPNGTYYYRVRAYNNRFHSDWSNSVDITVDWPPAVPKNLTIAVYPEGNAVNLSWDPNEIDTKEYQIYFKTTGSWTKSKTVKHPNCTFNHTGLVDGTQYFYRIRAVDFRDQLSGYTATVNAIPEDSVWPEPPTGLIVTPQSHESLLLTWEPNNETDLRGYCVYRTLDTSGVIDWGEPINSELIQDETYLDTGLNELTTYYYVVTALDEVPNESWLSDIAKGKTLLGPHGPEINNSIENFEIEEDSYDDSTIKLYYWFKDVNGDELTFSCTGDSDIEVTIFQENGTVILRPKKNWNGQELLMFFAEDDTNSVWDMVVVEVTSVNDPPFDVNITKPSDGIKIEDGEKLDFRAEYDDPDIIYGDTLDLEWSSNISGKFGNTIALDDIILSVGSHLITFRVTDQVNAEGIAYVNVTVIETSNTDSDLDGLPNYWEREYGLDPYDPIDADEDNDHDALPNSDEFELGTDPTKSDSDEDGLTDYDEAYVHFTDPTEFDTDGDGYSDSEDAYPLDLERWEKKSDTSDGEDEDSDDLGLVIGIVIIIIIIIIILVFLFVIRPKMKKKDEPAIEPPPPQEPVVTPTAPQEPTYPQPQVYDQQPQVGQAAQAPQQFGAPPPQYFPQPVSTQPVPQPSPTIGRIGRTPVPKQWPDESELEE